MWFQVINHHHESLVSGQNVAHYDIASNIAFEDLQRLVRFESLTCINPEDNVSDVFPSWLAMSDVVVCELCTAFTGFIMRGNLLRFR